jgi:hypothetical protein
MQLTEAQSRACFAAAYRGFKTFDRAFDVVIDLEHPNSRGAGRLGAGPISSGCANDGDTTVFPNCSINDFGDWNLDDATEEEFIDVCMESYGCIELPTIPFDSTE